jgi:Uncharacterized conserved protein
MAFDFKKEYKEFYIPPRKSVLTEIPQMNFVAVRGKGDPNEEGGEYKRTMEVLYAVAYTLKMSYKGEYKIDGFFEYVVPPLEGFWWQEGDLIVKSDLSWISAIRLPDFVSKADFDWAVKEAERKKKLNTSKAEFFTYNEGLCVQCMHIGSYDEEPKTISDMKTFARENGYEIDISAERFHHEIYLSNPRKTEASKLKTVLRYPIKKSIL